MRAHSSAVERFVDIEKVGVSITPAPTKWLTNNTKVL